MKTLCTTSLFYNKYIYKLRIKCPISSIFRGLNFRFAKTKLDKMQAAAESDMPIEHPFVKGIRSPNYISVEAFMDACVIYKFLERNRNDVLVRCEGYTLDIYSNTKDWLLELSKYVNATEFTEPEINYVDFLKENTNTVIVDNPPKYKFKVYFDESANSAFARYASENKDHIKIGPKALQAVEDSSYLKGYYFWVSSEKHLMLAKIALGTGISRIVKYVSRDYLHK